MSHDRATGEDAVAASYDSWADTYDADRNLTRDLDADVLRQAGLALAGRHVLEVGCGTGKNTVWLAEQAATVTALDFSSRMIDRARKRVQGAHVTFINHDVRHTWPVADHSIDVVVANLVLEHVEQLRPVFDEAARVLRPGGQYFLCELHPERQRMGGRAEFVEPVTGNTVQVAAYQHTVSEFLNAGLAAGLVLRHRGEHIEAGAFPNASPRLLSLLFEG